MVEFILLAFKCFERRIKRSPETQVMAFRKICQKLAVTQDCSGRPLGRRILGLELALVDS